MEDEITIDLRELAHIVQKKHGSSLKSQVAVLLLPDCICL